MAQESKEQAKRRAQELRAQQQAKDALQKSVMVDDTKQPARK